LMIAARGQAALLRQARPRTHPFKADVTTPKDLSRLY
jgi:hypothetical protein